MIHQATNGKRYQTQPIIISGLMIQQEIKFTAGTQQAKQGVVEAQEYALLHQQHA